MDPIGERVYDGNRFLRRVEITALAGGVSVPVSAGLLLMAGLLTPPIAGAIAGGALAVSALVFWLARGYRKGSEEVLSKWNEWPVKPGSTFLNP